MYRHDLPMDEILPTAPTEAKTDCRAEFAKALAQLADLAGCRDFDQAKVVVKICISLSMQVYSEIAQNNEVPVDIVAALIELMGSLIRLDEALVKHSQQSQS